MGELDRRIKILIEELYFEVKTYAEGEYNEESSVDITKKDSNKIIFKDRKKAITMIKEVIEDFSKEHNIDKNLVKNYLLELIEKDLNSEKKFKEEYREVKEMVSSDEDEKDER